MKFILRNYEVSLEPDTYGQLILEIYTQLDAIPEEQCCQIFMGVSQYLEREGFFDKVAPSFVAIYTKNGKVVPFGFDQESF